MAVLSRQQVYDLARSVGLSQFDAATAGAICDAESGRNTLAIGENKRGAQIVSVDRGLWQINSAAHPDVSAACAFDATCNAQAMARISSNGHNWQPWTTFNTGAYRGFLPLYLQIAGFAQAVPPQPPDIVGTMVNRVRAGYPLMRAVFQAMEQLIGQVNAAQFGGDPHGANLGSGLF